MIETVLLYRAFLPAFVIAGGVAYVIGRARHGLALTVCVVVWSWFTLIAYSGMEHSIDWGWCVGVLAFVCAPGAIGIIVGGAIGWIKGGQDKHA